MKWLLPLLFMGAQAWAAVWTVKDDWDEAKEQAYSEWVNQHWTNDVFTNPTSALFGLKTDCADAPA